MSNQYSMHETKHETQTPSYLIKYIPCQRDIQYNVLLFPGKKKLISITSKYISVFVEPVMWNPYINFRQLPFEIAVFSSLEVIIHRRKKGKPLLLVSRVELVKQYK